MALLAALLAAPQLHPTPGVLVLCGHRRVGGSQGEERLPARVESNPSPIND